MEPLVFSKKDCNFSIIIGNWPGHKKPELLINQNGTDNYYQFATFINETAANAFAQKLAEFIHGTGGTTNGES